LRWNFRRKCSASAKASPSGRAAQPERFTALGWA
jgi:hypothetical protein